MASDMIVRIPQERFAALDKQDVKFSQSLLVHGRPGPPPRDLVLLVHGWGGGRYGTWKHMSSLLFDDLPTADIGLYDYVSGPRRLGHLGPTLEHQAENLAASILTCGYDSVVLVCHSLGGIVAASAIANLLHSMAVDRTDPTGRLGADRLAALFLFGSPMAGTRRAPYSLRGLTKDTLWLATHSKQNERIVRTFADRVTQAPPTTAQRLYLPVYTAVGGKDLVVDSYSASLMGGSDRSFSVPKGHTALIRPASRDDQAYLWLLRHIKHELAEHAGRTPDAGSAPPVPPPAAAPGSPESARFSLTVNNIGKEGEVTGVDNVTPGGHAEVHVDTVKGRLRGAGTVGKPPT